MQQWLNRLIPSLLVHVLTGDRQVSLVSAFVSFVCGAAWTSIAAHGFMRSLLAVQERFEQDIDGLIFKVCHF